MIYTSLLFREIYYLTINKNYYMIYIKKKKGNKSMSKKWFNCSICGKRTYGYGNNPIPIRESVNQRCCDECNKEYVITARILEYATGMSYAEMKERGLANI